MALMQFAHVDQALCCPLSESMATIVYVDERGQLRSDCTDMHANLELPCSHMT